MAQNLSDDVNKAYLNFLQTASIPVPPPNADESALNQFAEGYPAHAEAHSQSVAYQAPAYHYHHNKQPQQQFNGFPMQRYGFFTENSVKQMPYPTSINPKNPPAEITQSKPGATAHFDPTAISANDSVPMHGGFPTVVIPGAEAHAIVRKPADLFRVSKSDNPNELFVRLLFTKLEQVHDNKLADKLHSELLAMVQKVLDEQPESEQIEPSDPTEEASEKTSKRPADDNDSEGVPAKQACRNEE